MSHQVKPVKTRSFRSRLQSLLRMQKAPPDLSNVSYSSSTNSDCRLLRLPAELRLHIYSYVIGENQVFHLVSVYDRHQPSRRRNKPTSPRIAHIRCQSPYYTRVSASIPSWCQSYRSVHSKPDEDRMCTRGARSYYVEEDIAVNPSNYAFSGVSNGNLALLRTCRQIYVETRNYPYSQNVFDLGDIRLLTPFVASLSVLQAHAIRNLQLDWAMAYGLSCGGFTYDVCPSLRGYAWWDEFWDLIATKLSLRELSISMGDSFFGEQGSAGEKDLGELLDYQARWVKPILRVRGLRKFWFSLRSSNDQGIYMWEQRRKYVDGFITALSERMVETGVGPA